ncbi:hypothetical protein [Chryseobacterium lathyri]|uniref:Uncharacterized protein n=1 Tax=Chryseobacterium lathyri TaxID=395933 RepID=A0ABT9SP85_9FLAO|nr:hypothetical protein [Chryseobacterium lathyri]MDP9961247.1 hypothetical protein [Chryseobacterium lathyri]
MKRSYFIFYGYAIAYCINMLFAWQIGNLNATSLAVQNAAVSSCSFCKTGEFTGYSEKDKTSVVSNASVVINKLYADRHQGLLYRDAEIVQQHKPIRSVENPKVWEGFDFIIKFPDKLS